MSLVVIGSDKGAPGATTAALCLAAMWAHPILVAEGDPAGADLPIALADVDGHPQLRPEPGMLSLAMAARRGGVGVDVGAHVQRVACGVGVLAGAVTGEQATAYGPQWPQLLSVLRAFPGDVLVDVGSLRHTLGAQLAGAADVVILVTRGTVGGLVRARERAAQLLAVTTKASEAPGARVAVLLVAGAKELPSARKAMSQTLDAAKVPVAAVLGLAYDGKAVAALTSGPLTGRLQKSLLLASAREAAVSTQSLLVGLARPVPGAVQRIVLLDRASTSV